MTQSTRCFITFKWNLQLSVKSMLPTQIKPTATTRYVKQIRHCQLWTCMKWVPLSTSAVLSGKKLHCSKVVILVSEYFETKQDNNFSYPIERSVLPSSSKKRTHKNSNRIRKNIEIVDQKRLFEKNLSYSLFAKKKTFSYLLLAKT